MTRASALVALGASVLLLAGCAPAPELPAPLTEPEAQKIVYEQNRSWWESMFPDEPMPTVRVVAVIDPGEPPTELIECLEGVSANDDGSGNSGGATPDAQVTRALFTCSLRFPYDLSDPSRLGLLSDEQQAWIWSYNRERLVPCLQSLGYLVTNRTSDYTPGAAADGIWSPYFELQPTPKDDAEWTRIDLKCPPPPVGPIQRPSLNEQDGG